MVEQIVELLVKFIQKNLGEIVLSSSMSLSCQCDTPYLIINSVDLAKRELVSKVFNKGHPLSLASSKTSVITSTESL